MQLWGAIVLDFCDQDNRKPEKGVIYDVPQSSVVPEKGSDSKNKIVRKGIQYS